MKETIAFAVVERHDEEMNLTLEKEIIELENLGYEVADIKFSTGDGYLSALIIAQAEEEKN